tara:strand:+ start:948 stop:1319 length:372 start_codon:yes stop_codon:yes gene_type:complete
MNRNKSFGILFFIVFLIIGLWPLKNGQNPYFFLIFVSFIFLILGLFKSNLLTPLNKAWLHFGEFLGKIIAPVVMSLVYFLILTPISLLVRIAGKDLLKLKFSEKEKSYWLRKEKNTGSMDKQF